MKKHKEKKRKEIKLFQNIRVFISVLFHNSYDKNVSKNNILVKSKLFTVK